MLDVAPALFADWLATKVKYTPQQWANWRSAGEEIGTTMQLPEPLIRLYLTQLRDREGKYLGLQKIKEQLAVAEKPAPQIVEKGREEACRWR